MRERLWKMAMVALMALFLATGTARAEAPIYSGGSGTPGDPYLIENLNDLRDLSEHSDHWNSHFRQTANIDAASTATWDGGAGWSPIGNNNQRFQGTYDGDWFTIDGLYLNRVGADYQGFFGCTQGATIKNLGLTSVDIRGRSYIGGLVGSLQEISSVMNSYSTGTVSGSASNVGGLVGDCSTSFVVNGYSKGAVSGNTSVGGLVGLIRNRGSVVNCYSRSTVSGAVDQVGGLAGKVSSGCSVIKSYSTGAVSGPGNNVAGFLGAGTDGTITNCFWDVDTSGLGQSGDDNYGATGKSTPDMKTESTFTVAGWFFPTLWAIDPDVNDGYPYHNLVPGASGDSEQPPQDQDGVYLVETLAHLLWIAEDSDRWGSDYGYRQVADIDTTDTATWDGGAGWSPIGNSTSKFEGTYDGGGFTIDGLFIFRPSAEHVGFFGYTQDATIKNLGLRAVDILGRFRVGGLVGALEGDSSVFNCYSQGAVSGTQYTVGGLAGTLFGTSSVSGSYSRGSISGDTYVGGLVGMLHDDSTVSNCYSLGSVLGISRYSSYLGGLAGRIISSGSVFNCYSRSAVSGASQVGGLVGSFEGSGSVVNSYSTGEVVGTGNYVGGFLGNVIGTNNTITSCFWDMETSGLETSAGVGATAKSTADMKTETTFTNAGWNFNTLWALNAGLNDGYPHHIPLQGTSGVPEQPPQDQDGIYLVATLAHLLWIAEDFDRWGSDYHYRQVADIDASGTRNLNDGAGWSPIGNSANIFYGSYDGGGFTIEGLVILRPAADHVGLFGQIQGGNIRNLGLISVDIRGRQFVGGLVGRITHAGSVINCYITGSVSGSWVVGGLAGSLETTSSVINSYSRAAVSGSSQVGGLVGVLSDTGFIIHSYSTGEVSGIGSDVGGFLGLCGGDTYTMTNCFWDMDTSGRAESAGVGATGQSTSAMKTETTFTAAGWNFNTLWAMNPGLNDGYPHQAPLQGAGLDSEKPDQDLGGVYLIETLAHLLWIAEDSDRWGSDYHYRQVADIDASGTRDLNDAAGWSPIGNYNNRFYGSYDGGGFTIDGLFIFRPATPYVGLFGLAQGAAIKNLKLRSMDIRGLDYVGGLVGWLVTSSSVHNCYSSGAVSGRWYVGGLLGQLSVSSSLGKSYSTADVSGTTSILNYYMGGLVGSLRSNSSVLNSYSRGSVSGTTYIGGLAGEVEGGSSVVSSYSTGAVAGTGSDVGGLVGYVPTTYTISDCFWDVDTSGLETSAGIGATGRNTADMQTASTFTGAGWVFPTFWNIDPEVNDGYPHHVLYSLNYSAGGNGSIVGAPLQLVDYGQSGSPVQVVPYPGFFFAQWSDGRIDNPRTDTNVMASMAVTAEYTVDLKHVIAILQVLAGMEPQVHFNITDGPVGISEVVRLLQLFAKP